MKIFIFGMCLILLSYIVLSERDEPSEKAKLAHHVMQNVSKAMKSRYQLRFIGISEKADRNYYKGIGMRFQIFRVLNKDECRKMLIDCTEELLKEINSNQDFLSYLQPSPFTVANVDIVIFVYHPDGKDTYFPDIGIFSVRNAKVTFTTDIPELKGKYGFYTEEEESYEEAVKIVESQKNALDVKRNEI